MISVDPLIRVILNDIAFTEYRYNRLRDSDNPVIVEAVRSRLEKVKGAYAESKRWRERGHSWRESSGEGHEYVGLSSQVGKGRGDR